MAEDKSAVQVFARIEITKEEYEGLKRSSEILDALYAAGVDNWEGYAWAMENLPE
jgi:hypothetical protein